MIVEEDGDRVVSEGGDTTMIAEETDGKKSA